MKFYNGDQFGIFTDFLRKKSEEKEAMVKKINKVIDMMKNMLQEIPNDYRICSTKSSTPK